MDGLREAFASPGTWVGVSFEVPAWVGRLTRSDAPALSVGSPEELTLETEEMSPGMSRTWGRQGGWAAYQAWARSIAKAFGGDMEFQSFRENGYGTERHEVRYTGPEVEDL